MCIFIFFPPAHTANNKSAPKWIEKRLLLDLLLDKESRRHLLLDLANTAATARRAGLDVVLVLRSRSTAVVTDDSSVDINLRALGMFYFLFFSHSAIAKQSSRTEK